MEADKNPMPELHLFPRVTKAAHFLLDHLHSEGLSDHAHYVAKVTPDPQGEFDFEAQAEVGW